MGVVRPLMPLLSRKERISFRNYDLRRAALNELTFFSLCIFVRYRSATPWLLIGSILEHMSIIETRVHNGASASRDAAAPGPPRPPDTRSGRTDRRPGRGCH